MALIKRGINNYFYNPLYLKILFILIGSLSIILLPESIDNGLKVIALPWAGLYLLWDLFHERRFLKGSFQPLTLLLLMTIGLSLAVNVLRYGQLMISVKNMICDTILLLIFAAPSVAKTEQQRGHELRILCNAVMLITFVPLFLAASTYFFRVNAYWPLVQIDPRYVYEVAGKTNNAYWIERFYTVFGNPNGVSMAVIIVAVCAMINYQKKEIRHRRMQNILCIFSFVQSYICLVAFSSRGAMLSVMAGTAVGAGVLWFQKTHQQVSINSIKKFGGIVVAGLLGIGVAFLILAFSFNTFPIIAVKTTELYEAGNTAVVQIIDEVKQLFTKDTPEGTHGKPSNMVQPFAKDINKREMIKEEGTLDRFRIWDIYINGLKNYFVFGTGLGNEYKYYDLYKTEHPEKYHSIADTIERAPNGVFGTHNLYLYLITSFGIFTLIAFLTYGGAVALNALYIIGTGQYTGYSAKYRICLLIWCVIILTMSMSGTFLFGVYDLPTVFTWLAIGLLSQSDYNAKWVIFAQEWKQNWWRKHIAPK